MNTDAMLSRHIRIQCARDPERYGRSELRGTTGELSERLWCSPEMHERVAVLVRAKNDYVAQLSTFNARQYTDADRERLWAEAMDEAERVIDGMLMEVAA